MDAPEEPKLLSNGDSCYVFFDRSGCSVTAFYPTYMTHLGNQDRLKRMDVDSLEKARADRTSSKVLELIAGKSSELSEISAEDFDVKSDAGTSPLRASDAADDVFIDDERCVDDILYDECVKKKLEVLAAMVGLDCTKPAVVLAQVVRVLKDLGPEERCI